MTIDLSQIYDSRLGDNINDKGECSYKCSLVYGRIAVPSLKSKWCQQSKIQQTVALCWFRVGCVFYPTWWSLMLGCRLLPIIASYHPLVQVKSTMKRLHCTFFHSRPSTVEGDPFRRLSGSMRLHLRQTTCSIHSVGRSMLSPSVKWHQWIYRPNSIWQIWFSLQCQGESLLMQPAMGPEANPLTLYVNEHWANSPPWFSNTHAPFLKINCCAICLSRFVKTSLVPRWEFLVIYGKQNRDMMIKMYTGGLCSINSNTLSAPLSQ